MLGLAEKEERILRGLKTPATIQDFVNKIHVNFEADGKDTCMSPLMVLRKNKCHCIEGALLAAAAIWLNKIGCGKPLVVDMVGARDDWDHVIAVFKIGRGKHARWGAISKTNHAVLRYREPVYRDIRELVMSYFHEYTDDKGKGKKTLRSYSMPVDLSRFGYEWIFSEQDLWHIHEHLEKARHYKILAKGQQRKLRKADAIEIKMGELVEWKRRKAGEK